MFKSQDALRELPHVSLLILHRISAALIALFALRAVMGAYGARLNDPYQSLLVIVFLLVLILIPGKGNDLIKSPARFWQITFSVAVRWALLVGILALLGFTTKTSEDYSRKLLFTWILIAPPLIVIVQYLIEAAAFSVLVSGGKTRRAVIAGANELGRSLARKIDSMPHLGLRVEGFFDDRSKDRLADIVDDTGVPIKGGLKKLAAYARNNDTDVIFVSLPIKNLQRVSELLDSLRDTTASIYFVPDIFVFDLIQCKATEIDGVPVISLCETPFQGTHALVKRASDLVLSSLVLLAASPLMLTIAMAIKATSPGPAIFKQRRYGLAGDEITVYKFRTMTVCEDDGPIRQATRNDSRVTPIGAFLRRFSLDELPQFFNVLQGSMSVVGPRPHAVAHNEEYRPLIKGYMVRHKVKPGITGLAQVHGCRGETQTVEDMRRRVEYDLAYLRDWSLMLDVQIIGKTISLMFRDKMAY